jgi:virginiamycin B lyase
MNSCKVGHSARGRGLVLVIGLGVLSLPGCYSDLDYTKIKCSASDPSCPGGYACGSVGLCIQVGAETDAHSGIDLAAAIDAGADESIILDAETPLDGPGIDGGSPVDATDSPLDSTNNEFEAGTIDSQLSPTDVDWGIDAFIPTITEFTLSTLDSRPERIIRGPDDSLWFTESDANKIGKITVDGQITEYPAPADCTRPTAITAGPNSDIWYADATGRLVRMTTTGTATVVTPDVLYSLTSIITGPDGKIWFGAKDNGVIGQLDPITQAVAIFRVTPSPKQLIAGADKAIWFTSDWYIGRITTSGDQTGYDLPQRRGVFADEITLGADGNLWFTEGQGGQIGRLTPSTRDLREFPLPGRDIGNGPWPTGIIFGKDGNLWFGEYGTDKIGRLTPSGEILEFALPKKKTTSYPFGIAAGPDGNIWFVECYANMIGRLIL